MQDAKIHRRRIRVMMGLIIFLGLFVVGRLFVLQIVNQKSFKERAERQYLTPVSESFDRGTIYFSKKDGTTMAAATVSSGFKVAIEPDKLKDIEQTYLAINSIAPIEKESFVAKANKKSDPYEEVALKLTQDQADQIIKEKLPGVSLYRQMEILSRGRAGFKGYRLCFL